ncbi:MAG TPA: histidinol dehydrogenase, partial [Solirubrobacteraceae bacterium]|nr:histidinol dehydrogenase [Solirubrobacteraceae bacterium]
RDALAFAEAFAPEHLELVGEDAERLARRVRSAGCVFVGANGATAFGDYVVGSNHCLPTGGAARFASGLSPRAFRRRMSEVHVGDAAAALAAAGAPIARAEGFAVHAESMEARVGENGGS